MSHDSFTLNTGAKIPAIGLGTWQSDTGLVAEAVEYALSVGYRHVDAAYCYGNEDEVGEGLAKAFASGIAREEVFVTTKLWCTFHTRVEENLDLSLRSLKLDYVDLYLMHWPVAMNPNGNHPRFPKLPDGSRDLSPERSYIDTYRDMEALLETGKVKTIGVCNHSRPFLEELLKYTTICPAVNQIENHPQLPQQEIVDFCKEVGIHVTSYSPLGSSGSPLLGLPLVKKIAKKYGVPPCTVLLSYHFARGSSVLAKSVNKDRILQNLTVLHLDSCDMAALQSISENELVRYVYPDFGVNFKFPDVK